MWPFDLLWGWTNDATGPVAVQTPVRMRDLSGARYGMTDYSGARYGVTDLSGPRYGIEVQDGN